MIKCQYAIVILEKIISKVQQYFETGLKIKQLCILYSVNSIK